VAPAPGVGYQVASTTWPRVGRFLARRVDRVEALRNDLEGARELGFAVEIKLVTGDELFTGLHTWSDEGWFSVYAPQDLRDKDTTRKVMVDQVSSWVVTDVRYHY